jgi:hypothetical protein
VEEAEKQRHLAILGIALSVIQAAIALSEAEPGTALAAWLLLLVIVTAVACRLNPRR